MLFTPCHSLHVKKKPAELPSLSRETVSQGVESGSGTGLTPKLVCGVPPADFQHPCSDTRWSAGMSPIIPLSANPGNSAGYEREKEWWCRKKAPRARRMESGSPGCLAIQVSPQRCSHPPTLWPLILFHPEEKSVLEAFLPIGAGLWTHTGRRSLHREKFLEALFLEFKQILHHTLSSTGVYFSLNIMF